MSENRKTLPVFHVKNQFGECWIWISSKSLKIVTGSRNSDKINVTGRYTIPIDVIILEAMTKEPIRRRLLRYILAYDAYQSRQG